MRVDPKRHLSGWLVATAGLIALAAPRPAVANFHFMLIVEVFAGSAAAPDAQYVVLQMYQSGQTVLAGHPMHFYAANGDEILPSASFGAIGNGADDARILIATSTAEALFGVAADLRVPAKMPLAGGKVCFDTVDCFAWEGYSGSATGVGTPFSELAPDVAARRIVAGALDAGDDSNDCEDDFAPTADPAPANNASVVGIPNPAALLLDGFEENGFDGWTTVATP